MFRSMMDQDLYKLTMGQAVAQHYPRAEAEYTLILRDKVDFPEGFAIPESGLARGAAIFSVASMALAYLIGVGLYGETLTMQQNVGAGLGVVALALLL